LIQDQLAAKSATPTAGGLNLIAPLFGGINPTGGSSASASVASGNESGGEELDVKELTQVDALEKLPSFHVAIPTAVTQTLVSHLFGA
jgi:hypothetical protein